MNSVAKTSNVRRFDSLGPRLYEVEVFFACVYAARIDVAALSEKAMKILTDWGHSRGIKNIVVV